MEELLEMSNKELDRYQSYLRLKISESLRKKMQNDLVYLQGRHVIF